MVVGMEDMVELMVDMVEDMVYHKALVEVTSMVESWVMDLDSVSVAIRPVDLDMVMVALSPLAAMAKDVRMALSQKDAVALDLDSFMELKKAK